MAPARILTGKLQHEFAAELRDRGPAGTAAGVGPPSPDEPAMPTQQRFRANKERPPAGFPQDPAGRSQEDTVGVPETRTSDLATKNRKLESEHDDLELLEFTRPQTQRHHREPTPKQQIDQRH